MDDLQIRTYLGAELARVPKSMTIVALTHAPPSPEVIRALHDLGVDFVLTGHAHSNRAVDHGGIIELNTEPLLMGGLDFTPAGYRVVTIAGGKLTSTHRTTVDRPFVSVIAPAHGACVPAIGAELLVAAELDAAGAAITARVDCATPMALRRAGGWDWRGELPALTPGPHTLAITATSPSGARGDATATIRRLRTTRVARFRRRLAAARWWPGTHRGGRARARPAARGTVDHRGRRPPADVAAGDRARLGLRHRDRSGRRQRGRGRRARPRDRRGAVARVDAGPGARRGRGRRLDGDRAAHRRDRARPRCRDRRGTLESRAGGRGRAAGRGHVRLDRGRRRRRADRPPARGRGPVRRHRRAEVAARSGARWAGQPVARRDRGRRRRRARHVQPHPRRGDRVGPRDRRAAVAARGRRDRRDQRDAGDRRRLGLPRQRLRHRQRARRSAPARSGGAPSSTSRASPGATRRSGRRRSRTGS